MLKHRRVFAGLFSAFMVMSAVAASNAAAAAVCAYERRDLPLPAGVQSAYLEGTSNDDSWIVGAYYPGWQGRRALLWVNGALQVLTPPPFPVHEVYPEAVNNTGVVVGRVDIRRGEETLSKAFRYENGTYETLLTVPGEMATAYGVNDAGDVVGTVWSAAAPGVRRVTMWPRGGGRSSFGTGSPAGIDSQRKIAFRTPGSGWIVDGNTGAKIELPGARFPMVLDNDRVLHFEYPGQAVGGQITERDLNGVRVAEHRGGYQPYGRNKNGAVFGRLDPLLGGAPTLWNSSNSGPVVTDKSFDDFDDADITDDGTLIASHRDDDGTLHPARWVPGPECG